MTEQAKVAKIFERGRYYVTTTSEHYEAIGNKAKQFDGYAVVNSETGVTEYSTTLLFHAIRWANTCEEALTKELAGQDSEAEEDGGLDWKSAVAAEFDKDKLN